MGAPLAELDELAVRLGVQLDPESAAGKRGQALLEDASTLIRMEGAAWDDPSTAPAIVKTICLAATLRAYQNPAGVVQASVGDVAVSYGSATGGGSIYLTKTELAAIRRAADRSTAASVNMTSDLSVPDQRYAEVQQGGDAVPMGPWPWEE